MTILNVNSDKQSLVNVEVGQGVKIFNFVNAYGCKIDDGTKIGAFVEIQAGASIGKNCKISSHTFICEGVNIGNGVFVGHNVSFINDMYPRAVNSDGSIQNTDDWELVKTSIGDGVSIGTSSTILGGVKIGENALIGAGCVVTKDVPKNAVVVGNPSRIIRYLE